MGTHRRAMHAALTFSNAVASKTALARGSTTASPARGAFIVRAAQNKVARTRLSQKERLYNKARKSEITTRMKKVFVNASELMAADACTEADISGLETLISARRIQFFIRQR